MLSDFFVVVKVLLIIISNFTDAFDCYYCANCLNTQRGVRLTARSEDWCYKVVWRSGPRSQQVVSRGASADCRQDSYDDQNMAIPGVVSGTARYCCRRNLCNSTLKRGYNSVLLIFLPFLCCVFSLLFFR